MSRDIATDEKKAVGTPSDVATDDTLASSNPKSAEAIAMDETVAIDDPASADTIEFRFGSAGRRDRQLVSWCVGRYVVLEEIGRGGMGVVYAGYDPDLDRRVAIKLIRTVGPDAKAQHARLLGEAQALAKVSHPNVVTVHDVGEHKGQIYVAMEHIDGRTLTVWRKQKQPSWRAIIEVMVTAARGLAAVHAAGLVHRDIKPDNIMVTEEGRVVVMDLGLARADATEPAIDAPASAEANQSGSLSLAGALVGTPAYMAPEQHAGEPADKRTDQYSFAVALYELLNGVRPYAGNSIAELSFRITQGDRTPALPGHEVPGWLKRIVDRGLSRAPEARWPTIGAMAEAMERGRARVRRRRVAIAVTALCVIVAGFVLWRVAAHHRAVAACESAASEIDSVWPARSEEVEEGIRRTRLAYATATHAQVTKWLDRRATSWRASRESSCLAATVDRSLSPTLSRRAISCLEARRAELATLVDLLATGDLGVVELAVRAAASLPDAERCADPVALSRGVWPDADKLDAVTDVRRDLARAALLGTAAKHGDGLVIARAARATAADIGWAPLIAEADLRVAALLSAGGRYRDAVKMLAPAYYSAVASGADETAGNIAIELSDATRLSGDKTAAHLWANHARAMVRRVGQDDGLLGATARRVEANTIAGAELLALRRESLAILERILGREHPDVGIAVHNLALALGRKDQGRVALQQRAISIFEKSYGDQHPYVASAVQNLGNTLRTLRRFDEAEPLLRRALAIRTSVLGPTHPKVAQTLRNLGFLAARRPDPAAAKKLYAQALAVLEQSLGSNHIEVGELLVDRAQLHIDGNNPAEATSDAQRALSIYEATFGPTHPETAQVTYLNAIVAYRRRDLAAARRFLELARDRYRASAPNDPKLTEVLAGLGEMALLDKRYAEAVTILEEVLLKYRAHAPHPGIAAEAHFYLARALWHSNRERPRALKLARRAQALYRSAGPKAERYIAEIEAWLAKRSPK